MMPLQILKQWKEKPYVKTNYENVEVCYDDQKYVKLNMKSSIGVSPGFITLIVKKAN